MGGVLGAAGGGGREAAVPRGAARGARRRRGADPHPAPGPGGQLRRLLPLQLRDGQRHRAGGAGLPEERGPGRGRGGAGGPGLLLLHVARGRADQPHLRGGRERLPAAGRAPAHAAAHPP